MVRPLRMAAFMGELIAIRSNQGKSSAAAQQLGHPHGPESGGTEDNAGKRLIYTTYTMKVQQKRQVQT
uniref:Uncharacterized protein n=1 Tax=Oryza barthii TaxID=65489 RepID=A0A0D3EVM1_9ORYZ